MQDNSILVKPNPIEQNRIFLHVCCGPCAEWPIEFLRSQDRLITVFFYNPNIHPLFEHDRRLENVQKLMRIRDIPLVIDRSFMEKEWRDASWKKEYISRCLMCYDVRMRHAANAAKINGFTTFTSSLLVSPYQDFGAIIEAGHRAAKKEGIHFLPIDFRDGFRKGQQMAKDDGLYRQKYCGCIFSLESSTYKEKIYVEFDSST